MAGSAEAQTTYTWTRGGAASAWNNAANWSPTAPATGPVAGDTAVINTNTGTSTTGDSMTLNGDRAAASLLFTGGTSKWLLANGPNSSVTNNRILTLTAGITADSTSGPAFVGFSNQTSWRLLQVELSGNQSITNNSANALTFGNGDNIVSGTYRPGSQIRTTAGGITTVTFTGTGAGDIIVNGEIVNGGAGASLSTIINRPGRTVVFNADNTNSGSTAIQAGTLRFGSGGAQGKSGTNSIDIAAGATLAINRTDAFNVPNAISGGGSLVNSGSGTVQLTGSNSFTGGTTINSGTVQVGGGGINGTLPGDVAIAAGAGLAVSRTGTVTLPGAISGLGAVTKLSSGLAILTGSSSYAGPTSVSGGTLQIGDGGTTGALGGSSGIAVASGAALAVNRSNAATQGVDFPVISGSGGFTQAGVGSTTLTQANTYSGLTTVSGGTLAVSGNGSIGTGGLSLGTGGVFDIGGYSPAVYLLPATGNLAGSGSLAGAGKTLQVAGSFGPGSGPGTSPGTLTLNGVTLDLSTSATSTFEITSPSFAPGSFDLVAGTGGSILGGVLNLIFSGGPFANQADAVKIFDVAGGLTGGFTSVTFSGLAEGQTATFDASTGFVSVAFVPEPGTLAGALLCGASAACCRWYRRRRSARHATVA